MDRATDNMVCEAIADAMNVNCSEYKIMMETQGSDRNKLYTLSPHSNGVTGTGIALSFVQNHNVMKS